MNMPSFNIFSRLNRRWTAGIVVSAFVLVTVFIVWPTWSEIGQLRDNILAQQQKLEESYQKGLSLRRAQESVAEIRQELDRIDRAIMAPGEELTFITNLEQAAAASNLTQKIVMDDLPPGLTKITGLPVSVDLNGSFTNFVQYLSLVEQYPFYVNWEHLTVTSGRSATQRRTSGLLQPEGSEVVNESNLRSQLSGQSFWRPRE